MRGVDDKSFCWEFSKANESPGLLPPKKSVQSVGVPSKAQESAA